MAAADGLDFSVRKAVLPPRPSPAPVSAIVPSQALKKLARVADGWRRADLYGVTKGRVRWVFRVKDVEVVSQLIDGTFPIISRSSALCINHGTLVSTSSCSKACKQAEIFAREGLERGALQYQNSTKRYATQRSGNLRHLKRQGKNETIVEATVVGSGVLIAFNVKFLREALEVIKTPNVVWKHPAPTRGGIVATVRRSRIFCM